jgi:hypothetical protein
VEQQMEERAAEMAEELEQLGEQVKARMQQDVPYLDYSLFRGIDQVGSCTLGVQAGQH